MVIFCLLSYGRCDATADDLIDVVEGNRTYVPCIYLLNKIDQISIEELGKTDFTNWSIVPIFKVTQKKYAFNATLKKRYLHCLSVWPYFVLWGLKVNTVYFEQ